MVQLFTKEQIPRSKRTKRMHVVDAGTDNWVEFKCRHCGHENGWKQFPDKTITELKRGLPCPKCKGEKQ